MAKPTKVVVRRKKFLEAEVPLINKKIQLVGNSIEDLKDKTIKLDLTRQLRGKSIEATLKINIEKEKAIAKPRKIVLLPYFIRRMIRKRTSYVEDTIITPTQESMVKIKPFLITRKKVSRVVRKTLRNLTKNWIEDYLAEIKDEELFEDILSNKLQKPLSLKLKKTYPLSLCEIRVLEILRPLNPEEIPKKSEKVQKEIEKAEKQVEKTEKKQVEKAEKEIKQTQKKAEKLEEKTENEIEKSKTKKEAKEKPKSEIKKEVRKKK